MTVHSIACFVLICAAMAGANASPPRIWTWVELQIESCQPATFEAPAYPSADYIPGTSHKATVIRGTVASSGIHPYRSDGEDLSAVEDEVKKRLPKPKELLVVATVSWSADLCQTSIGRKKKFDFNYGCDTSPRIGSCLVPLPLVEATRQ